MCQNTCIVGNYDIYVFFSRIFFRSMGDKIMNRISNEHEWIYLTNESYAQRCDLKWLCVVYKARFYFIAVSDFMCVYCVCMVVNTKHNRKLITLIVNIHCGIRIKSKLLMVFLFLLFSLLIFAFLFLSDSSVLYLSFSLILFQLWVVSKQLILSGLHTCRTQINTIFWLIVIGFEWPQQINMLNVLKSLNQRSSTKNPKYNQMKMRKKTVLAIHTS